MKLTKCPACGSQHFDVISSYDLPIKSSLNGFEFTQHPYNIDVCKECGIHFKDNILSQEEFIQFYENIDFAKWNVNKLFPPEEIILDYLSNQRPGLNILDFGCSEGRLLSTLVGRHECYGFDYNKESLKIAEQKGIHVFFNADQLENQGLKFDIILMIDVFEHLLNPDETIGKLISLLKENGQLIISTGHADNRAYKKKPAEFWYFLNLEHVCMISNRYIDHIIKTHDLKTVFKEYTSHYKLKGSLQLTMWLNQFLYWKTLRLRKFHFLNGIYPFSRIFKFGHYPYYPITKDHIVLSLQRKTFLPPKEVAKIQ